MQTFWPSGRGVGLLTQRGRRRAGSNPAGVGLLAIAEVHTSHNIGGMSFRFVSITCRRFFHSGHFWVLAVEALTFLVGMDFSVLCTKGMTFRC